LCGTWGGAQPYYGGADGFEKVLDLLEDACDGLLNSL
jgi:protein-tyrosine phosphatase